MSNSIERSQIIRQNEALYVGFSGKLVLRSRKVIKGPKSQKKVKRVNIWFFAKVYKLYVKMKFLT